MFIRILIISLLVISVPGYGQKDYSSIDKNSERVPDSLATYAEIAQFLTKDLSSDEDKARAIYYWIARNIEYNLPQLYLNKRYFSTEEIILEVLQNRSGVCQHYSELFHAMARSADLTSYVITGYTRNVFDRIDEFSHSWNAIQLDSNFYMIDVTWAAGYVQDGKYVHKFRDAFFLKTPVEFLQDHMPFDPIWQCIDNPLTYEDFLSRNYKKLEVPGAYNFIDSISLFEELSKPEQLDHSNRRIRENKPNNSLIRNRIDENILQISYWNYIRAIDTLNSGIENYNEYISLKNWQFRNPKTEDSRIKELIDHASSGVYAANDMMYRLFSSNQELNDLIVEQRNRMPAIISDIEREKDFVDRYLRKWKPLRIFMFLKL